MERKVDGRRPDAGGQKEGGLLLLRREEGTSSVGVTKFQGNNGPPKLAGAVFRH